MGSVLQWVNKNCNNAGWMYKIDDDVIFNPFVFKTVFTAPFIEKSSHVPLVIGYGMWGNPVSLHWLPYKVIYMRIIEFSLSQNQYTEVLSYRSIPLKVLRTGKWTVDESFTPNVYPVHAIGASYILSRRAVDLMSTTYFSKSYPGLWIEDAYLTGVLREGNTFFTHTHKPKTNNINQAYQ